MTEVAKNYTFKKLIWINILFFGITTLLTIILVPLYLWHFGFVASDWVIFTFMAAMTMLATTMGYHRYFAHRSFDAHPVVVFLNVFFGAATFGGSILNWSSQHRDHHKFTDTDRDPYDITKGFWFAHMDWFLRYGHLYSMDNVQDLIKNRLVLNQHKYYPLWAIGTGIVLPLGLGLAMGNIWGAFVIGVLLRLCFIHHSIFFINSAAHTFGKPTYDKNGTAKDSWVCALLTHGEGYHSFHHRFPSDFRNGVRWYHWDPTKWMIRMCAWLGLADNLRRAPEHQILAARSETEATLLVQRIRMTDHPKIKLAIEAINQQYAKLKRYLHKWEVLAQEHRRLSRSASSEIILKAAVQMKRARKDFLKARKEWLGVIRQNLMLVNLA